MGGANEGVCDEDGILGRRVLMYDRGLVWLDVRYSYRSHARVIEFSQGLCDCVRRFKNRVIVDRENDAAGSQSCAPVALSN